MKSQLVGRKFGELTVIDSWHERSSGMHPKHRVRVRCSCGKLYDTLRKGLNKSSHPMCMSCRKEKRREAKKTFSGHPLFKTWDNMLRRCASSGFPYYKDYGARGVYVCDRWRGKRLGGETYGSRDGFETFCADMGPKPSTRHTLDRKDNDGPYSPENCQWATPTQQVENNRSKRTSVCLGGREKSVFGWCELFGLPASSIYSAIKRGRTPKEALLNAIAAQERREAHQDTQNPTH